MEPLRPWEELRRLFTGHIQRTLGQTIPITSPIYQHNLDFALSRFEEGVQLAAFLPPHLPGGRIRLLDLGAGNGGVSLALANDPRYEVLALDVIANSDLLSLRRVTGLPIRQIVARGEQLPFRRDRFDTVLCLETIEHVPEPGRLGAEAMRVLRPGGLCMVTTPARLKYLFRPDPHFGVPRLLLRPDSMQRRRVVEKLRLTTVYDVVHIFWTVGGVVRNFTGPRRVKTLCNIPYPGVPSTLRQWLWYASRRLLWDRILIFKR
jgi:SAM-dependent methyltransferase